MLKQDEKRIVLKPFVVAYAEDPDYTAGQAARTRQPGTHLSKEEATKEVLVRIRDRVKRI
jgi:hypothetical protein